MEVPSIVYRPSSIVSASAYVIAQMAQPPGRGLGAQRQLGCQETVRLGHGRLCSIEDIVYKLPAVWQLHVAAIDIPRAGLIHQKQVIGARPAGEVAVLT